jgi:hypothetical protein
MFRDWCELFELALANGCDLIQDERWQKREKRYLDILGGIDMAKKKTTKPKLSKLESFWQLFGCFCFRDNESRTYTELIDRVKFFNENQTIVKKIPESATPQNACLVEFFRRIFFGTPKYNPQTEYEYLWWMVNQSIKFDAWCQDNFKFFHLDETIDLVLALLKPGIPKRFRELNPEMSKIEELARVALATAQFKGELYEDAINRLEQWRRSNPNNENKFVTLHALLKKDFTPRFTVEEVKDKTVDWCLYECMSHNEVCDYDFMWDGKDIARMRAEIDEPPNSYLKFKKQLFTEEECNGCVRLRDEQTDVYSVTHDTLIPCKEESVDFDTTKNLYIEGDNLRALKLLMPSYAGKIKMIYIDHPYNTRHKFVYKDDFMSNTAIFEQLLMKPIARPKPENEEENK